MAVELNVKTGLITGAARRMTSMLALELAPNIAVNAVAPELILPPPGRDETYVLEFADTVPLQHHGNPQDIADAVAFLIQSDFITGNVVYVDGGRHLHEYANGSNRHWDGLKH